MHGMITRLLILLSLAAVPPLTPQQQAQLDAVQDDTTELLEPGLDALLTNILQWESADEAGARIPDYDGLLNNPAGARGDLFLIEGRFAGRSRRYKLREANPWMGDALTEWVILVREEPEEVAVVYFLDPEGLMEAPGTGADVRLVGRFYKVWADTDQQGQSTRYLTFVARSATVAGQRVSGDGSILPPIWLIVVVLGMTFFFLRQQIKRRTPNVPRRVMLSGLTGQDQADQDPAEALKQMTEQHKDIDRTGENHGDR